MIQESMPQEAMPATALARELFEAYNTGTEIPLPPSAREPEFTIAQAYEVEAAFQLLRAQAGHRAVGRKVGYANKAMWRVLKLETLVWKLRCTTTR